MGRQAGAVSMAVTEMVTGINIPIAEVASISGDTLESHGLTGAEGTTTDQSVVNGR